MGAWTPEIYMNSSVTGRIAAIPLVLLCHNFYGQMDTLHLGSVEIVEEFLLDLKDPGIYEFDSVSRSVPGLDAGELLQSSSGVFVKDYGPGTVSSLSYRGGNSYHTRIFWDGISVDNTMLGSTDVSLIRFDDFIEPEFHKGGNSMSIGSGGFGGILNVKSGFDEWNGTKIRTGASLGSFNTHSEDLRFMSGNGKLKFETSVFHSSSENDYPYLDYLNGDVIRKRGNASFQKTQLMPSLSYRLNKKNTISLSYWHLQADREVPSAIGVSHGESYQLDIWNRGMLKWTYKSTGFSSRFSTTLMKDELNYFNPSTNIISRSVIQSGKSLLNMKYTLNDHFFGETQLKYDYSEAKTSNYHSLAIRNEAGLYQNLVYRNKWLFLSPAARMEFWDGNWVFMPAFRMALSPVNQLNKWQIFGDISANSRRPTWNDLYYQNLGNPDLIPEKNTALEFGSEFEVVQSDINYNLRGLVFINHIDDMIVWIPDPSGVYRPDNIRSVFNRGFELEISLKRKWNKLYVRSDVGYTYTNSRLDDYEDFPEFQNKQQIYVPLHKINGLILLEWNNFWLTYRQIYTGKVFINNENTVWLPHSFPANLGIGRRIHLKKHMMLISMEVRNIASENYQYVANWPMPGRNYLVSLKYSFDSKTGK